MPTYRVYGSKVTEFYTVVAADDRRQAYEIANSLSSHEWDEVETIDANDIEITDIIKDDEKAASVQGQIF